MSTREELDVFTILEGEQSDPIKLPLEDPVGAGEAFLCQRRRHRHKPFGKWICCDHSYLLQDVLWKRNSLVRCLVTALLNELLEMETL